MTVQTTDNRINYPGDDVTASFAFNFETDDATWINTYEDGVLTTKNINVVLNANQDTNPGGSVNFLDPAPAGVPATDVTLTIERIADLVQDIDYNSYDSFPADTHEAGLDKLTYQVQQLNDAVDRSIKADVTVPEGTDYTLPAPNPGKGLLWNPAGDGLDNTTDDLNDIVTDATTQANAAAASASAASSSASSASSSAASALTSENNSASSEAKAQDWAEELEDVEVEVGKYSSLHHAAKAEGSATDAALAAASATEKAARNKVQNQDPMTQGESTRSGMSSTIDTGTGVAKSITTGVDMTTGDFGGLVWRKSRSNAYSNVFTDTVRGAGETLYSDTTGAEGLQVQNVTAFNNNGFDVGTNAEVNGNTSTFVTWSFQTTKKTTGTTNRNKAYTCHYNPDMNFSIVGYVGDGVDGHEIPHHLGDLTGKAWLSIRKPRNAVDNWPVHSSLFSDDNYCYLNLTNALAAGAGERITETNGSFSLTDWANFNTSAINYISYNFASKSGVCKIGKYIGTGAAGNYVSTEVNGGDAFESGYTKIKALSATGNWVDTDAIRGDNKALYSNLSSAEATAENIYSDVNGFRVDGSDADTNALNVVYIYITWAKSSIDATKAIADYPYATSADTLSIQNNTLVSLANGFNSNGQVDTQYKFTGGVTKTYGVGHEGKHYYIYTDKLGTIGQSEVKPLSGITRKDCDKYGLVSPTDALALDNNSRTTDKHFDYESPSGVVLASGENGTDYSWKAFNKTSNDINASGAYANWLIATTTTSWLQYKHTEKRILKSWKIREADVTGRLPKRFTIEGSNDGLNWTAIDSTYTASDYTGNGVNLWGALQSTSANSTAYLYHRINITANSGDATFTSILDLEFNTVSAADYFLVGEGQMYDSSDVAQERMYLGELKTDSNGDIINSSIINYPVAEQEIVSAKVHQDLTVYGEIEHWGVATAKGWFDGGQNPPLITSSRNILDVVDLGTGIWKCIFNTPMDTDDYEVLVTKEASGNFIVGVDNVNPKTKSYFVISSRDYTGAYLDVSGINFVVFGGKKIK